MAPPPASSALMCLTHHALGFSSTCIAPSPNPTRTACMPNTLTVFTPSSCTAQSPITLTLTTTTTVTTTVVATSSTTLSAPTLIASTTSPTTPHLAGSLLSETCSTSSSSTATPTHTTPTATNDEPTRGPLFYILSLLLRGQLSPSSLLTALSATTESSPNGWRILGLWLAIVTLAGIVAADFSLVDVAAGFSRMVEAGKARVMGGVRMVQICDEAAYTGIAWVWGLWFGEAWCDCSTSVFESLAAISDPVGRGYRGAVDAVGGGFAGLADWAHRRMLAFNLSSASEVSGPFESAGDEKPDSTKLGLRKQSKNMSEMSSKPEPQGEAQAKTEMLSSSSTQHANPRTDLSWPQAIFVDLKLLFTNTVSGASNGSMPNFTDTETSAPASSDNAAEGPNFQNVIDDENDSNDSGKTTAASTLLAMSRGGVGSEDLDAGTTTSTSESAATGMSASAGKSKAKKKREGRKRRALGG